jgi:murein DD-endopeptidase MepM/ murein hydrolase activator NlpD
MGFNQVVQGGGSQTQEYGCSAWAARFHTEWDCPSRCGNSFGWHAGVDIAAHDGAVLLAVGYGTRVIRVRDPGKCGGLGAFAVCINSGPVDIWYGHCSKDLIAAAATVVPGQPIALMDSLGCSTGTHLHFEVQPAGQVGGCTSLDPTPYLTHWPGAAPGPPNPPPLPPPLVTTPDLTPWLLAAAGGALLIAADRRE